MTVDTLVVRQIRQSASIGIYPWERDTEQVIEVDVELGVDTTELLRTGRLSAGVDFRSIVDTVRDVCGGGHVDLVETLADRIANRLLDRSLCLSARVQVRKFGACESVAGYVAVEVTRTRREPAPRSATVSLHR